MEHHSKRSRQNKPPKSSRKSRPIPLRPIISGEISSPFLHQSDTLTNRSSASGDLDRLNDIIDDITSEGDDARAAPPSKHVPKSTNNLVEPDSPPIIDNHSSLYTLPTDYYPDRPSSGARFSRTKRPSTKPTKSDRFDEKKTFSPSRTISTDDKSELTNRRKSVGDLRRQQLTECMEYYRHCLESAQHSNTIYLNDNPTDIDKRKQYTTAIW
jgi:hypothetical protein